MRAPSFKIKLLLSMMLVVVGVAGATLYLTQQNVQRSFLALYGKLFRAEIQPFIREQTSLLKNIKQSCRTLVGSPRVQLAFAEAAGGSTEQLYSRVSSELETRQVQNTFFLFLDASGKIITPPEKYAEARRLITQPRLKEQLEYPGSVLTNLDQPIAGFIAVKHEDRQLELQQAVVTRVADTESGETLGALILGLSVPSLEAKKSLFFQNELYSTELVDSRRTEIAQKVLQGINHPETVREKLIEMIESEPHQIFFQLLNPDPHFPKAYLVALISIKAERESQRDLRVKILLFSGAGLIVAFAMSMALSHGLSVPISELVKGTAEIQRGNFEIKVPVRSRDEIGHLAESFNEMAVGLAQKEKYRNILNMVADKEVADELIGGRVALAGETRDISVLFCDIRGFTPLTQGMDPEEVIRMLNEHMTALTRVVYEYHGVVDKFVGDLIMAIFGAPKSYGNDALNATACAMKMIQERARLNETSQHTIRVGIGVASGPAVAGCMGSVDRSNYTVLGERVNLASRLCSKAGRMEVVVDETTRQRLGDAVQVETIPELELKGFSFRVTAYKVLDIRLVPV